MLPNSFRRAVCANFKQQTSVPAERTKVKQTFVFGKKVDCGNNSSYKLTHCRAYRSPCNAPLQTYNKQSVQQYVCYTACHRYNKAQTWFLRCGEKTLIHVLQHEKGQSAQNYRAVGFAQRQHLSFGTHPHGNGLQKQNARHGKNNAGQHGDKSYQGKVTFGKLVFPLADGFGNNGGTASTKHKPDSAQHHYVRKHQIDCREGVFPHKIGYKKPVYNGIDGNTNHH